MQDETRNGGQERMARLVALKRHERPDEEHWLALSRAVRLRVEQESFERGAAKGRSGRGAWGRFLDAVRESGWDRWLEPSAWVPTVLAVVVILAWMLPPSSSRGPGTSNMAGFGHVADAGLGLGLERPKMAPINGVHVRIVVLDSDQLPPGFVAFPPLPPQMLVPRR